MDKLDIKKSWIEAIVIVAMSFFYALVMFNFSFEPFIATVILGSLCLFVIFKKFKVKTSVLILGIISYFAMSSFYIYGDSYVTLNTFFLVPLLIMSVVISYNLGTFAYIVPGIALSFIVWLNNSSVSFLYVAAYIVIMLALLCRDNGYAILKLLTNLGITVAITFIIYGYKIFTDLLSVFPLSDITLTTPHESSALQLFMSFITPQFWCHLDGFKIFMGIIFALFIMFVIYTTIMKFIFIQYEKRFYKTALLILFVASVIGGVVSWIIFGITDSECAALWTKICLATVIPLIATCIILFPREKVQDFNKEIYNLICALSVVGLLFIVGSFWFPLPLSLIYAPILAVPAVMVISQLSRGFKVMKNKVIAVCILLAICGLGIANNLYLYM